MQTCRSFVLLLLFYTNYNMLYPMFILWVFLFIYKVFWSSFCIRLPHSFVSSYSVSHCEDGP